MRATRTVRLDDIEVKLTFDHQFKMPSSAQIHDSIPRPERVLFSIEVTWTDEDTVTVESPITSVVNYAPIYRFIQKLTNQTQLGLVESVLDELCVVAFDDKRVNSVWAKVVRLDLTSSGSVGATVQKFRR